jgi:antitoxin (DNA-binding transcriptional repressor) of toxin-antitoxin stability system
LPRALAGVLGAPTGAVAASRVVTGIMAITMTRHMTEVELVRDVRAVLESVRRGVEVVIESGDEPVVVLKAASPVGRRISDVLGRLEHSGANAVIDEDFARDVDDGVRSFREPWNPSAD